jgi:hypothetical protein
MMFKMLYGWMVATNSAHFSNFLQFLDSVLPHHPKWVFLLYTPYLLGLRPFAL